MGTDIHLYIEKLRAPTEWSIVPPPLKPAGYADPVLGENWHGPGGCLHDTTCYGCVADTNHKPNPRCPECAGIGRDLRWYRSRNYNLFGVLAGVRNNVHQMLPLARRGLPRDATNEVLYCWRGAGHDATWCTLDNVHSYLHWDKELRELGPHKDYGIDARGEPLWPTLRMFCSDFLRMCDLYLDPLLGDEHMHERSVWHDDVLGGGDQRVSPHRAELFARLQQRRQRVRLIYWFDS